MTEEPFELLHIEIPEYGDSPLLIDVWLYPLDNAAEIFYNRILYANFNYTHSLKQHPQNWIEHPHLGRMAP